MPIYRVATYTIRPDARMEADQAMHELASHVRTALPGVAWTAYRDRVDRLRYISITVADDAATDEQWRAAPGVQAFWRSLERCLAGEVSTSEVELVTSSNLAPRHRPERGTPRRRSR